MKKKKIGILTLQKIAKTGNTGEKKSSGRLYQLPYNSFVPLIHFFFFCIQIIGVYHSKCGIVNGTCVSGLITSFNRCFNLESIIPQYYFLTHSGYLSVFLFTCLSSFSGSVFLWICFNFLRYRAASNIDLLIQVKTEEIRRLVMRCFKLYLLDLR